jgi:hypothetical protein
MAGFQRGNDRKPTKTGHDFAQQLDALARKLVLLRGNARDVAARKPKKPARSNSRKSTG